MAFSSNQSYTSVLYDTTIIEIFENKDDIKDFLELDFDINEEFSNNKYINKSIYTLQYPNNEKVSVSYGIIKNESQNAESILQLLKTAGFLTISITNKNGQFYIVAKKSR